MTVRELMKALKHAIETGDVRPDSELFLERGNGTTAELAKFNDRGPMPAPTTVRLASEGYVFATAAKA